MLSTYERRIQAIVTFLTLALHFFLLCALFILTRRADFEPLRITADPQFIEYLLNNIAQQPTSAALQNSPMQPPALPGMTPALANAIQMAQTQAQPEPDEPGFDTYTLKNAVSYGSFTQGSVIAAGQEYGGPQGADNSPEPAQLPQEQLQEVPGIPSETKGDENESGQDDNASDRQEEQAAQDQEAQTSREQLEVTGNSAEESQHPMIDPMSGISPIIAAAESIVNDSGSSFVTPSQATQEHAATRAQAGPQTPPHTGAGNSKKSGRQTGTPKKLLTIADITRSYVKHAVQEQEATSRYTYNKAGSSLGTVTHGAYAPPTSGIALSEQLYASKLYNLLEQSAQAYSNQIYSCSDLDMQTVIEVTIEKSGKIVDVALNPIIPEKDMERAICLIVKKVGLFPPIPRQFHKQRIILSIPIHIRSKQGFASYRLLYGLSTV